MVGEQISLRKTVGIGIDNPGKAWTGQELMGGRGRASGA